MDAYTETGTNEVVATTKAVATAKARFCMPLTVTLFGIGVARRKIPLSHPRQTGVIPAFPASPHPVSPQRRPKELPSAQLETISILTVQKLDNRAFIYTSSFPVLRF